MFIGIEVDPGSGEANNFNSIQISSSLKKAIKKMKKHLKIVNEERIEGLSGVYAYIIDTDLEKVVVELVNSDGCSTLQSVPDYQLPTWNTERYKEYYSGIKTSKKITGYMGIHIFAVINHPKE